MQALREYLSAIADHACCLLIGSATTAAFNESVPCRSERCHAARGGPTLPTDGDLLYQLARRDAERVRDRCFAWLPPEQQREIVETLTRIARDGLEVYRRQYQRLTASEAQP